MKPFVNKPYAVRRMQNKRNEQNDKKCFFLFVVVDKNHQPPCLLINFVVEIHKFRFDYYYYYCYHDVIFVFNF